MISTLRLDLIPGTIDQLRAELEIHDAFSRALGANIPPSWPPELYDTDAVNWSIRRLEREREKGVNEPFGFFYMLLREERMLVGAGGFRGGPDEHGSVEIGYAVAREYRRRGLASEAVRGWVDFAFADPRVRSVSAQTLEGL